MCVEEGQISYVTTLDDFLINPNLFYSEFGQNRNILILPKRKLHKVSVDALIGFNVDTDYEILKSILLPRSYSCQEFENEWDLVTLLRSDQRKSEIELLGLIFPDLRIQNSENIVNLSGSQIIGNLIIQNDKTYGNDVKINRFLCSKFEEVHEQITDDEELKLGNFNEVEW